MAALPGLRAAGLRNGVQYWDGQFEDARLALALAQTAARAGALLLNHTRVTAVTPPDAQGLHTVHACDAISGRTLALRSRAVVNATGVWVDHLRTQSAPDAQRLVSPSQGVHVVVDQRFMPTRQALLVPRTRDGRVLFAVPWLGALVLGTTDTPRTDLPQDPEPFAHEVDFILQEAAQVLQQPITRQDVKSVWVGLRPLVAQQAGQETKALSREHTLVREANGMISITGGKWTTFRVMAEDTLAACVAAGALPARAAPQRLRAWPNKSAEAAWSQCRWESTTSRTWPTSTPARRKATSTRTVSRRPRFSASSSGGPVSTRMQSAPRRSSQAR